MPKQKAIIFEYISKEEETQGYTLDRQLNRIKTYAEKNEYSVLEVYAKVNASVAERDKDFLQALKTIEKENDKFIIINENFNKWGLVGDSKMHLDKLLNDGVVEIRGHSHECFIEPVNINTKVWRYIDLAKFLNLLQTQSIYFTRADFLRQSDKREGALMTKFSQKMNDLFKSESIAFPMPEADISLGQYLSMQAGLEKYNEEKFLRKCYISCWHIADFENFAMWKIYSDTFGVSIQSTFEDLCESFSDVDWNYYTKDRRIYVGKVNYIDTNLVGIPFGNLMWPYMHKAHEFSYEQELRCMISDHSALPDQTGILVKVNLDKLIKNIHISPFAPQWFRATVSELCSKYGVGVEKVVQSNLS